MIGPRAPAIGYHRFIAVRQTGGKRSEAKSGKLEAGEIVEELRVEKWEDARSGSVLGLSAFRSMRNVPSASCRCDVIQRVNLSESRVRSLKEVARVTRTIISKVTRDPAVGPSRTGVKTLAWQASDENRSRRSEAGGQVRPALVRYSSV